MPITKHKVINALFDIKPVSKAGMVNFEKISRIQPVLNLGRRFRINKNGEVSLTRQDLFKQVLPGETSFKNHEKKQAIKSAKSTDEIVKKLDTPPNPINEFEKYLNKKFDARTELASVGVEFHGEKNYRPRYRPIFLNKKSAISDEIQNPKTQKINEKNDHRGVLAQINLRVPVRSRGDFTGELKKIDALSLRLLTLKTPQEARSSRELAMWTEGFSKKIKVPKLSRIWFLIAGFGLIALTVLGQYGLNIKKQLIVEGNSAIANLENAGENIKNMDFVSASDNFTQAYREFSKAGDNLNFMGAGIGSLLSDLPGAGKLKSAKNLIEAGKLIADAGQAMSEAMGEIAKTNLILLPTSDVLGTSDVQTLSIGGISMSLKKALTLSKKNLEKARQLLADVDDSSIPEDKKADFEEFKSKLPLFEKLVDDLVGYSRFLEDFIGTKGTKKYLILFQNPSELRPTGGFPGTYGVVSFKDGKLQNFKVDDVYNLDGQLQELIVPPVQLQHITPNWGMRDANWFIDFPESARKIAVFFKKESGYDIDGVITFSPQIVAHILGIVGSVEMPEYNLTLDSKNLFSALQEQVEYKGDRKQPKQIIVDLAPKMLEKLYSVESGKWLDVFNLLVNSMEQKDILMYFRDLNLQSFSADKDFSGQVKNTGSDYLMVTFTNIKGSKTDLVIDSSLKVQIAIESGDIKHKVSITRAHNGGDNKYGFYNKQSPTYVRVLVPDNAEFIGLAGNSRPNFKPLIDYANSGFKKDEDLARFEEESYTDDETGVTIYKEAGKTEYGFWMIINPGETKTVDLEYTIPSSGKDSQFYVQKQPGLEINDFKFYINGGLYYDGRLEKDIVINLRP